MTPPGPTLAAPPLEKESGRYVTLEVAARKLGWPHSVLLRMSRFFQVPAAAYANPELAPLREELSFDETELAFFRQVREEILAGRPLEAIRRMVPRPEPKLADLPAVSPRTAIQLANKKAAGIRSQRASAWPMPFTPLGLDPWREHAQKTFQVYKQNNASGQRPPVFKRLLAALGAPVDMPDRPRFPVRSLMPLEGLSPCPWTVTSLKASRGTPLQTSLRLRAQQLRQRALHKLLPGSR